MFVFVIKEIRKKKNITVYNLSKTTGIARTYLLELENNKKFNPSLSVMYKIANALEVKTVVGALFAFGKTFTAV